MSTKRGKCICPRRCDCDAPHVVGVRGVSNYCPEHNEHPLPDDECEADEHWDGSRKGFYGPGYGSKI